MPDDLLPPEDKKEEETATCCNCGGSFPKSELNEDGLCTLCLDVMEDTEDEYEDEEEDDLYSDED